MTELKEELKVRPEEGATEYAERVEGVLERHEQETGEKISPRSFLDGEGPSEVLERVRKLDEAEKTRWADWDRARSKGSSTNPSNGATKDTSLAGEKSSRSYRIKSQRRDVERIVADFEGAEKKLYRADGSKVYGDEEHAERLAKLREEFSEKLGKVVSEVEQDAQEYDKEALAFSYTDLASQVPASERGRLEASREFVREDCEDMAVPALAERISAVSAGSDKVARALHARYGRRRLEALNAESNRLAQEGRPARPGAAQETRSLAEAVASLEEQLKDPKAEERRQAAQEAAKASRRLIIDARRQQGRLDGTAEIAKEVQSQATHAAF